MRLNMSASDHLCKKINEIKAHDELSYYTSIIE